MAVLRWFVPVLAVVAIVFAFNFATPRPAEAFIHEVIAALCNGGDDVEPPGQTPGGPSKGNSVIRALLATGFITGTDFEAGVALTIFFDPTVPNSKFISIGADQTIAGAGPGGIDLIFSPGIIPDRDFPAFANCNF